VRETHRNLIGSTISGLGGIFMRAVRLSLFVFLFGLPALPAEARMWTWHTGKPWIEAEFVRRDGNCVLVRTPTGKELRAGLSDLIRADQIFVDEKEAISGKSASSGATKLEPEVYWSDSAHLDGNNKPIPTPLVVAIFVTGTAAANASQYGMLKIDANTTDRGVPLQRGEVLASDGLATNFWAADRVRCWGRGILVKVYFDQPSPPVKTIRKLAGSFKLKTVRLKTLTVENVAAAKDLELQAPLLKTIGLIVKINPSDNNEGFQIQGNDFVTIRAQIDGRSRDVQDFFYSMAVTDSKGHPYYPNNSFDGGGGSHFTYSRSYRKPLPADARLRLTLLEGVEEVTIPFEFRDLAVPLPKPTHQNKK
jgi:hypothetical protein